MRNEVRPARDASAELVTAHAIIEESFALLPFPIRKEEAIAQVGDTALPWEPDLTLGDILRGLPDKAFRDPFRAARAADDRVAGIFRALAAVEAAERGEP